MFQYVYTYTFANMYTYICIRIRKCICMYMTRNQSWNRNRSRNRNRIQIKCRNRNRKSLQIFRFRNPDFNITCENITVKQFTLLTCAVFNPTIQNIKCGTGQRREVETVGNARSGGRLTWTGMMRGLGQRWREVKTVGRWSKYSIDHAGYEKWMTRGLDSGWHEVWTLQ